MSFLIDCAWSCIKVFLGSIILTLFVGLILLIPAACTGIYNKIKGE